MTATPTMLPLDSIRLEGGTQPRAGISEELVREYADLMRDGATFPPVTVFHDGANNWLADGFHRVYAARQAAIAEIAAEVRQGTRRDAVLYSVGANATHGQRRSSADKRRAVMTLLQDEEWGGRSNRWIAERCAVSPDTVNRMRHELETTERIVQSSSRTGQDGRTIDTTHIGRRAEAAPATQPAWVADTAQATGLDPAYIRRLEAVGHGLRWPVQDAIRYLPVADNLEELEQLARLPYRWQVQLVQQWSADLAPCLRAAADRLALDEQASREHLAAVRSLLGDERFERWLSDEFGCANEAELVRKLAGPTGTT